MFLTYSFFDFEIIMAGGLLNIISYGPNDLYLTGSPQITFFKQTYRRYTNFATESIPVELGDFQFGDSINITIPKVGDLMSKTYLQIIVPLTLFLKTDLISDPTNAQLNELSGLSPMIVQNLITKSNQYIVYNNIILPYVNLMIGIYRNALNDVNIINLDAISFVNNLLKQVGGFNSVNAKIISDYVSTLRKSFEETQIWFLNPELTNISDIIGSIFNILSGNPNFFTKEEIVNIIGNSVSVLKMVQDYYFNQLQILINDITVKASPYAKFAWNHKLGYALIDYITVNIGGDEIDRNYGDWLNIWHELTRPIYQRETFDRMIGNIPIMTTFDRIPKPQYVLSIPLDFWFCRRYGLAFPLVALQYENINLTIKLRRIEDVGYIESLPPEIISQQLPLSNIWENKGLKLNGTLLVDYVFLDQLERQRFARSAHEYLIERVQRMEFENVFNENQTLDLDFRSPVKEIIWVSQKDAYINNLQDSFQNESSNLGTTKTLLFNYGLNKFGFGNPTLRAQLFFNGISRFGPFIGNYFNYVQPYEHHTSTPSDGINVYSFSLFPEEHQPSSTANFGKIASTVLDLLLDKKLFLYKKSDIIPNDSNFKENIFEPELPTTATIHVYALSYNILRVIGGMSALAYY